MAFHNYFSADGVLKERLEIQKPKKKKFEKADRSKQFIPRLVRSLWGHSQALDLASTLAKIDAFMAFSPNN